MGKKQDPNVTLQPEENQPSADAQHGRRRTFWNAVVDDNARIHRPQNQLYKFREYIGFSKP